MKTLSLIAALLLTVTLNGQFIKHSIEQDDFTGALKVKIIEQDKDKEYNYRHSYPVLESSGLRLTLSLFHIDDKEGDPLTVINWVGSASESYGGAHRGKIIVKFADGETVSTQVVNYDTDYSYSRYGSSYTLSGMILADPYYDEEGNVHKDDKSFYESLRTKDIEAVRIYFGDGYVNFDMTRPGQVRRFIAELESVLSDQS